MAGLVIAVALLASREPALVRLTPSPTSFLLVAAVLIGVPVLVLRLDSQWVLVPLGLALTLGFLTWRTLPAALTLEPAVYPRLLAGAGVSKTRTFPQPSLAPGRGNIFLRAQSASAPHRLLLYFLLYPALALLGVLSAPFSLSGHGGAVIVIPLLTVYLLMLATQVTTSQLAMLDTLPISRRFLFAAMVVPSAAAWLLAYGIVALIVSGGLRVEAQGVMICAIVPVLTGVLWFCLIALSLRNRRYTSGMAHFYALIAALVGLVLLLGLAIELGWLEPDAPVAFIRLLATALPSGTATLVLLGILVLGAAYALAEARFRRFELAPQRGEPETLGGV